MLFESYHGTSKFYQLYLVHLVFVSTVHFSEILMVLNIVRIYIIDFFLSLEIKSLDILPYVY